ncbi:MAG: hypothetical protein NZ699_07075 [Roseiflexus sp.]|nr:hypothetical protein [Roseiflexus sp.]MCS7288879.1 hypothetical protein [Roseiflexus sp.]MDW8146857.1 hypothetical protein [Roseiflexaceae bacterium]
MAGGLDASVNAVREKHTDSPDRDGLTQIHRLPSFRANPSHPLAEILDNHHAVSRTVRDEVSPKWADRGYQLSSVYTRKVHFRDASRSRRRSSTGCAT